jgi:methionyl-tRNA formyltransferase
MSESLRVVYMGTPDFAVPALRALIASHHDVVGVFTQPDRQRGRGKKVQPPPVKQVAVEHDIPVYQPESVKTDEALDKLEAWEPDVTVVAAYGQILPKRILECPRLGSVNIHASLLPKYRGAAPINWCLVHGEDMTGVTMMKMDEGLDTGPILTAEAVEIPELMTAQELHDVLAELGAEMIVEALDDYAAGELEPTPQDDDASSYAPMLSKKDGRVDWTRTAREVADHIRGFNPWPGAFTYHGEENDAHRIKLHLARATTGEGDPGEVLEADPSSGTLRVACGAGAVDILEIQAPGKRAMDAADFLNGYDIEAGEFFV